MQVSEHQKGPDGVKPADTAQPAQQTAEQQQLAAGPPAGAAAVEPPEEEKYTVHVPEGLTYFDVDLIKLTAQFVARNGKGFLTGAALPCSCICRFILHSLASQTALAKGISKMTVQSMYMLFTQLTGCQVSGLFPGKAAPVRTLSDLIFTIPCTSA